MSGMAVTPPERVGALRGAPVGDVDGRRLVTVAVAFVALGLAVAAVALSVAGARKNAEISDLRQRGVPVVVTVTGCMGLLGGSGSNAAGYACRGTYTLDGRRHEAAIPGHVLRRPGATVAAVTLASDPGLVSTQALIATEHPTPKVFVLPAVLAAALVLLLGAVFTRRLRTRRAAFPPGPAWPPPSA